MRAYNSSKKNHETFHVNLLYLKTKNYIYNISLEFHLASSGKSRVSHTDTPLLPDAARWISSEILYI